MWSGERKKGRKKSLGRFFVNAHDSEETKKNAKLGKEKLNNEK